MKRTYASLDAQIQRVGAESLLTYTEDGPRLHVSVDGEPVSVLSAEELEILLSHLPDNVIQIGPVHVGRGVLRGMLAAHENGATGNLRLAAA